MKKINKTYNPDVLNCIANLSNDEVFTPPALANKMLDTLPQSLFSNPDVKFLDPFCKSGVFLREIVKRLDRGLASQMPDVEKRINHILKKQVYGIAITELTSLLSRRTVYCSKVANGPQSVVRFSDADGNIYYKSMQHTWVGGKCKYCGASQSVYERTDDAETYAYNFIHVENINQIFNMKFDVIIGNPPYQLNDGGGTGASSIPLYNKFVEQALKLSPRYLCMIIPARWYAGGKGLDDFRTLMLECDQISTLVDYPDSRDCFPQVTVAGGICYFLWERNYHGQCLVVNIKGNNVQSSELRMLSEFSTFVRDNDALHVIRNVFSQSSSIVGNVYSRNCFSIISNECGHANRNAGDYVLLSLKGKSFISRSQVTDRDNIINKFKVVITKAMSGGNKPTSEGNYQVISSLQILVPNEVCTETYLCIGAFDNYKYAENMLSYAKTKFFRFMLLQSLTSINISKDKFQFVPLQDFSHPWTDEMLYEKYKLDDTEIDFIESMIKPME